MKDCHVMELIPGFTSLVKNKWNFCAPELVNRNLPKQDKVLLTLRAQTGTSYTTTILKNLTEKGRLVYDELFLFNILPDDILNQIVSNIDSIFDLIRFRASCATVFRLIEKPEILELLMKRFHNIIMESGYGTGKTDKWNPISTFSSFLYWYSCSTIDTPNCDKYHNIRGYILNKLFWKDTNKLQLLFEKYMKYECFSAVRNIFNTLTISEKTDLLANIKCQTIGQSLYNCSLLSSEIHTYQEYIDGFFLQKPCLRGYGLKDILLILCKEHRRENMQDLLSLCDTDISYIFDDIRFIELVTNKGVFYKDTAFHILYHWIIDPKNSQTITTRIVSVAIVTYEKWRAQILLNKIPKNAENKKRIMQAIFVLVGRNMNEVKKYESWIDSKWE